ncbi:MAG: PAS domain-containing sensor histidine kinase [Actinomycetota bacterium]|nr:PAS domain-containing sensor histidine kinase [Actinomycetota bacterium]
MADRVVRGGVGLRSRALHVYVAGLSLALAAVLAESARAGGPRHLLPFAVLTVLFALTELTDLTFHGKGGDWGLSASEALLLPMVVVLSPGEVVWGVTAAIAAARLYRWRAGALKGLFNVAQYGCGAAAAAAVWTLGSEPAATLTARNAGVAVAAVLVFTVLTHAFVALAMAISGAARFTSVVSGVVAPAAINLAGSLVLGLLFAAALPASRWTVAVFPLPLLGLYLGYRAVLRQRAEAERLRHLHAASRALAAAPGLDAAVTGFLRAVREIVSARETRVVVKLGHETVWSGVSGDEVVAEMAPLELGGLARLVMEMEMREAPLLLTGDGNDAEREVLAGLDADQLVAVPLLDAEGVLGCLVAIDRVGAGDFGESDSLLLGAVAGELLTTLDAHRLYAEVAEERRRFARIFHGSREGIALLDARGVVRAWNPALERITGYVAADVMGRPWSDRVVMRREDQRRLRTEDLVEPVTEEVEVVTKDGPGRWVSITAGPVETAGDNWVWLVRDVTAEHEAEEAKGDFLSTISHELRTPLTSIKGALQVLERGSENVSGDLADQMVSVMQRGSERLERLVMNLLLVSQIEAGALPPGHADELALGDVVRRVSGKVDAGHRLRVVEEADGLVVRGDAERLEQVVEHVLDNAVKFGGPDGLVTVAIARDHGYARVSVSDEGPGIARGDQERIFDRFVRLGHVLTRSTQGPGVGLFIAKRALEVMGGDVWVESEPGRGATFHIQVPLARPVAVADSA